MKLISILLSILILSPTAKADFEYLPKGASSPYDGYLITPEREKKFRLLDKELQVQYSIVESQQKLTKFQEDQINIMSQRITLYREENTALAETLAKKNSNTFWENVLFFTLGVAATSALAIGLSKAL